MNETIVPADGLSAADMQDLAAAVATLENPGLVARLTDLVGRPVEIVFDSLPAGASEKINRVVRASLSAALDVAVGQEIELWSADQTVWIPPVTAGVLSIEEGGDEQENVYHLHFIDPPLTEMRQAVQELRSFRGPGAGD